MTALAKDRITPERGGWDYSYPVAAATTIYAGALVLLNAAREAVPASATPALTVAGASEEYVANPGAAGAKLVQVRRGTFRFVNGDTIVQADIGKLAYALDDQTVVKGGTARTPVGVIVDVDSDGVWVHIGPRVPAAVADADLTDNTTGAANGALVNVGAAVAGVDGTGSNAASKADVDTRLAGINDNFADVAAEINALKAQLRAAGALTPS